MVENKFTNEQLQTLLESQRALNVKYTGEDWMEKVPLESFLVASFTEVAEFYESAPRVSNWKWWKKNLENDDQNMIIETIDVLHFGLSALMYNMSDSYILEINSDLKNDKIEGSAGNILTASCEFILASNSKYIEDGDEYNILGQFYDLINSMAKASDRTLDEIYNGYFKKNELNHKRVDGGYQEGNYQKIDENGNEDNVNLIV